MSWISDQMRVRRAGRIARNKTELEQLKQERQTEEVKERIKQLSFAIAKDEERNKIASEKNIKPVDKTKHINKQTHNNVTMPINYKGTQTTDVNDKTSQNLDNPEHKQQSARKKKSK